MNGAGNCRAAWQAAEATDGHAWEVLCIEPPRATRRLVWLPALGVAARHYEPFARAMADEGVAVYVHEWRGLGSSSWRASRQQDWDYRTLLQDDIPRTLELACSGTPGTPAVIGGHSLGGQLATCMLALEPSAAEELWLVASGVPYARVFPWRTRLWLPAAYKLLAGLARAAGALPGRRIGFGGREARSVIRDWARTALTGRYAAPGVGDLEPRLRDVRVPVRAVLLQNDWLAPRSSLDDLVARIDARPYQVRTLDSRELGTHADHFEWMKAPSAVVAALARPADGTGGPARAEMTPGHGGPRQRA